MTRMMEQYMDIKKNYKDAILFFRLGDFYEMFLDDARIASAELGLTLTSRAKGEKRDEHIMCGVPYHAADSYIAKLCNKGYKVAICEQMEDPATAKGKVVEREVVRVITPGTITDENVLDDKSNNFLCSVYRADGAYGVAFADISTGDVFITESADMQKLINEISCYNPAEIVISENVSANVALCAELKRRFCCMLTETKAEPEWENSVELILGQFEAESLTAAGLPDDLHIINAAGQLLLYIEATQKSLIGNFKALKFYRNNEYMEIDTFTRRNLELTETMRGGSRRGSLLWVLDKTRTSMGGRMLKSFIEKPLVNCTDIRNRLYAVDELVKNNELRDDICNVLTTVNDIERLIGSITSKKAKAPDLISLKQSIKEMPFLREKLSSLSSGLFANLASKTDDLSDIYDLIDKRIADDVTISSTDGEIIKRGADEELDTYVGLLKNSKATIVKMEAAEKEKTGIKTLRISYNKVFGYYIEVSKSYRDMLPEGYVRRQTLANGERYITEELKEMEEKILSASENVKKIESRIFAETRDKIAENVKRILNTAESVAYIDVLCSLAEVAIKNNYVMPYVDLSEKTVIKDGRHPVVEKMLKDELFVPNDTFINTDDDRMLIITGPNMAGKSTYMRQVALFAIMAQIGSFVPASSCSMGICDKVFTRVGASDDLAAGQSTFMVEMTEVASILKNATRKSLIVFDEIGRGTSTYDGLSIAWSVCEYVADKKKIGARTLFATHYHELLQLEGSLEGVKNYSVACKKRGDDITFLRRIIRGGADRSYGIEVACLAGLPPKVIKRAKEVLAMIDAGDISIERNDEPQNTGGQIGFSDLRGEKIAEELQALDLSTLTPIEALNKLYELQQKALK